ncbi:adenosylcobinamide-phosphate synthase [Furfurilactobacillus siliginis]|uniref:Cobalamin biosynthesis protein CobD n=1 Tax=Furfurilactobacillus siliginis TaxID=348151 RepID=A0A0R2L8S5_9LACO|nr:adenosylcobinamide-phosphate synthase [Furfurilactobacillus siliginis]
MLGAGIMWVASFNYWLLLIIGSYFCYSCLSIKGLAHEGLKIARSLRENNLGQARKQVGMIVGRDTQQLDAEGVMDATVETIAENTSDGVIAPLIFMAIAGPVGGLMYKAVNTLDSMVGYKDDRFKDIGFVSAKLDDVFNWIPARFTWLLLVIASFLLRFHVREAITIGRRDREKHLSPNSGFSESVVAGALNIRLGGPHMYFGKLVEKPFIGSNNARTTEIADIQRTVWMLYVAASLGLLITVGCRMLIER